GAVLAVRARVGGADAAAGAAGVAVGAELAVVAGLGLLDGDGGPLVGRQGRPALEAGRAGLRPARGVADAGDEAGVASGRHGPARGYGAGYAGQARRARVGGPVCRARVVGDAVAALQIVGADGDPGAAVGGAGEAVVAGPLVGPAVAVVVDQIARLTGRRGG